MFASLDPLLCIRSSVQYPIHTYLPTHLPTPHVSENWIVNTLLNFFFFCSIHLCHIFAPFLHILSHVAIVMDQATELLGQVEHLFLRPLHRSSLQALAAFLVWYVIYQRYFHPLRRFPGPCTHTLPAYINFYFLPSPLSLSIPLSLPNITLTRKITLKSLRKPDRILAPLKHPHIQTISQRLCSAQKVRPGIPRRAQLALDRGPARPRAHLRD